MTPYPPLATVTRIAHRPSGDRTSPRTVPEETPVALSYRGTTHAVMMATPADLEDFALGFSLTEGIVASRAEVLDIEIVAAGAGIDVQVLLADTAGERFQARRRMLAGPVGCGLCGIESIDEAMRAVKPVSGGIALDAVGIGGAVRALSQRQPMHAETGAVHAAGFFVPGKGLVAAREDVGRHNALDKLAGLLAREGVDPAIGAIVMTSRISVELVQKAAAMGCATLVAISAPTALAIRTADAAGITLVALVRGDEYDIFTHPERVVAEASAHVD